MPVRIMLRCKKCGELWPTDDLHKHAVSCFNDSQMDPETIRSCYEFAHSYKQKELITMENHS